jgi:small basic protein (TIGR04137 family)
MTMDRTLKVHGGLLRSRSVLTRAERIAQLTEEDKFDPEKNSPLGLPKVRVKHSRAGQKAKKVAEEVPVEGEGVEGAEGAEATEEKSE